MNTRRAFGQSAIGALAFTRSLFAGTFINSTFNGVQLGVQSYSFRDLPLQSAIAAMKEIGIGECELFMGHVEPDSLKGPALKDWRLNTPLSFFEGIRNQFDSAGVSLYAYSLNFNDHFSDAEIDRGFQMTRALGTSIITTSTTLTCARRLVAPAEKYKIKVAMHGHDDTSDPNQFATPQSFAAGLAMSPQFYINLDIGHFSSAGFDPVRYVQQHHAKILALHIKDRKKNHGPAVLFGEGNTPIKEVLLLLRDRKYAIPANVEYEYNDDQPGLNTVAEVRKCFDYCKRILTASAS